MVEQTPSPEDMAFAASRRGAFMAALSRETVEAEDKLPAIVGSMNASSKSKLQRIYVVADKLSEARAPYVACGKGCASCCHMNVSLTREEAERLGAAIGRRPVAISRPVAHSLDKFAGMPCTFLDEQGSCGIYAHRPLSCRKHASFFANASPCHPSVMNDSEVPTVNFSGLDDALFAVSGGRVSAIVADIRDFFPKSPAAVGEQGGR